MGTINSVLFKIEDIDQSFLPGGKFDPTNEQHADLVIEKYRRDGGADGYFTDVQFDGLVIQISPNADAEKELKDCIEILQLGGFRPAMHRMQPLIKKYPYNIHLLYNYGMALREVGEVEESIDVLSRATNVAPSHVHCWVALAVSYQTVGNDQEALKAAESAYQLDNTDSFVLRTLGYILQSIGEVETAKVHLERVLEISPDDAQTHWVLGNIKQTSSPQDAKHHYKKVVEYAPGSSLSALAIDMMENL